jgi:hypothetical protein
MEIICGGMSGQGFVAKEFALLSQSASNGCRG